MSPSQISERGLRREIVFAFALALACYLAWLLRKELVLLYVSGLFAVVLLPLVRATGRLRIGRWRPFKGWAILILLLVLAAAIVGARESQSAQQIFRWHNLAIKLFFCRSLSRSEL